MALKLDLMLTINNGKEKFVKITRSFALCFYTFILLFPFVFWPLDPPPVEASVIQNDKLIERVSKDYTNKFCNSIAFGLSKESAMQFANKENNMIFKKRKGMDTLNQDSLAHLISISVVENCGYLINLKGEKGIIGFEKDYISMNKSLQ
tara:strand:- start:324 stop:770 length:447 start_codon:yes stop_codon:yes gene_type:complete